MATEINGAKLHINFNENAELAKPVNTAWKERDIKLETIPLNVSVLREATLLYSNKFEYYMRRGKKYYFRGVQHKVVVTLPDPSVFSELKYHDQVDLKWVAED